MGYGRHYPSPPQDLSQQQPGVQDTRGSSRNGPTVGHDRSPYGGYGDTVNRDHYESSPQVLNRTRQSENDGGYGNPPIPGHTQGTTASYRQRGDYRQPGYGSGAQNRQGVPYSNHYRMPTQAEYKDDSQNSYWSQKENKTGQETKDSRGWQGISTSPPGSSNASKEDISYHPQLLQEIVATTEPPYPEEVPLSLAIVVGEDSAVRTDNSWRDHSNYHPPRSRKREPTVPPRTEEDPPCDPQNTIIITALVVSAIHVGLMLGGFFCFRWQRRALKRRQLMSDFNFAPVHTAVSMGPQHRGPPRPMVYGKADMSFRQMYGEFETPP